MLLVIPYIFKGKVGKNSHFVLKYSDIESLFLERRVKDVYLEIWSRDENYRKRERDRLRAEGNYKLVDLSYNPQSRRYEYSFSGHPWKEVLNPTIIECGVYAISNEVSAKAGLTRQTLREIMVNEIEKIAAGGLFDPRWHVSARLYANDRILECISQTWKGVKEEPGTKRLIDLSQFAQRS